MLAIALYDICGRVRRGLGLVDNSDPPYDDLKLWLDLYRTLTSYFRINEFISFLYAYERKGKSLEAVAAERQVLSGSRRQQSLSWWPRTGPGEAHGAEASQGGRARLQIQQIVRPQNGRLRVSWPIVSIRLAY